MRNRFDSGHIVNIMFSSVFHKMKQMKGSTKMINSTELLWNMSISTLYHYIYKNPTS